MTTTIKSYFSLLFLLLPALLLVACGGSGNGEDPTPPATDVLAFPGAEGGGKYTTGGRGTAVYAVTTLDDDVVEPPAGSLRRALQATGNRIVVFRVSGRIDLKGELTIKSGKLSILGQSAPGDGICVSGYSVVVSASDVIIRFMRFRMGDEHGYEGDALTVKPGFKNIMIDHCSCSWCTDECVSIYGVENATVQYCFITEGLNNSVHAKGAHGYGGIWGGKNTTFHHNLLAHHKSRNPRFDHDYVTINNVGPTDYINNVVYNWGSNVAYGGESTTTNHTQRQYNFIANYYRPGAASSRSDRILNPTTKCADNCIKKWGGSVVPGKFYLTGNVLHGNSTVTNDNWTGVYPDESSKKNQCMAAARFTFSNAYTGEQSANDAFQSVLNLGGCSLHRDAVDTRIAGEVKDGTITYKKGSGGSTNGLIDTPSDVGGWPDYKTYDVPVDADKDNIPDAWELAHGLDPTDFMDATYTSKDNPPYMNLEVYLNELVQDLYVKSLVSP